MKYLLCIFSQIYVFLPEVVSLVDGFNTSTKDISQCPAINQQINKYTKEKLHLVTRPVRDPIWRCQSDLNTSVREVNSTLFFGAEKKTKHRSLRLILSFRNYPILILLGDGGHQGTVNNNGCQELPPSPSTIIAHVCPYLTIFLKFITNFTFSRNRNSVEVTLVAIFFITQKPISITNSQ